MLAPQLGYGAFLLLLSPDHVGTQVPLLAGWLLLDVAPRRWWVPATLCLLLAAVQFADRVAVLTAVLPLICRLRAVARDFGGAGVGRRWFELALIAAGILSVGVAWAAARLLAAAGGFAGHPFPLTLAPLSQLWTHTWLTGWGILELYGANFIGVTGWVGVAFAVLHLIGLTLAIVAVAVALGGSSGHTPRRRAGKHWWTRCSPSRSSRTWSATWCRPPRGPCSAPGMTRGRSRPCCRSARCWPGGCSGGAGRAGARGRCPAGHRGGLS